MRSLKSSNSLERSIFFLLLLTLDNYLVYFLIMGFGAYCILQNITGVNKSKTILQVTRSGNIFTPSAKNSVLYGTIL